VSTARATKQAPEGRFSIPETLAFRESFRREHIPRRYSGSLHVLFAVTVPLSAIVLAASRLREPTLAQLSLFLPLLLLGSLTVFVVHKYLLHRPVGPLRGIYKIHALQHHRFFTHEVATYDSRRDFYIVFFPWFTPLATVLIQMPAFYFFAHALGASENVAIISALINPIYYLLYELFHYASHVQEGAFILRIPMLRYMREHHRLHHDPRLMARYNFNVVIPVFDWIFGTYATRGTEVSDDPAP
jgi:hypothetical protein